METVNIIIFLQGCERIKKRFGTEDFFIGGVPRYCGHFWPIAQIPDDR
jgi:hypothetical protein